MWLLDQQDGDRLLTTRLIHVYRFLEQLRVRNKYSLCLKVIRLPVANVFYDFVVISPARLRSLLPD